MSRCLKAPPTKAVSLPATMTNARPGAADLAIAAMLVVIPMAEAPVTPILPLHQLCRAIHSMVS